jgi:hypothetical protein
MSSIVSHARATEPLGACLPDRVRPPRRRSCWSAVEDE